MRIKEVRKKKTNGIKNKPVQCFPLSTSGMQMEYTIPQEFLDDTDCLKEFSCLSNGKCGDIDMCKVNYAGSKNITFLKQGISDQIIHQCHYALKYYDRVICRCPIRHYLYQEYRI